MFKQQRTAVGYVPGHQFGLLKLKLKEAGYLEHNGPRVSRDGEVATYRLAFEGTDGRRQNHVQIVARGSAYAVYAHTEPHTERLLAHALSAVADGASFSGGSRMLSNDLAAVGYRLVTYADAIASVRQRA